VILVASVVIGKRRQVPTADATGSPEPASAVAV